MPKCLSLAELRLAVTSRASSRVCLRLESPHPHQYLFPISRASSYGSRTAATSEATARRSAALPLPWRALSNSEMARQGEGKAAWKRQTERAHSYSIANGS